MFTISLPLFFPLRKGHNATKAQMIRPRVDVAFATRANDVSGTVLIGAQERATTLDFLGLP